MSKEMMHVRVGSGMNKPVIMEVIGEDGQKVGEHVEGKKSKKPPYYILEESCQNDV